MQVVGLFADAQQLMVTRHVPAVTGADTPDELGYCDRTACIGLTEYRVRQITSLSPDPEAVGITLLH